MPATRRFLLIAAAHSKIASDPITAPNTTPTVTMNHVQVGPVVELSEALGAGDATYGQSLYCDGNKVDISGGVGSYTIPTTLANGARDKCTLTNSRPNAVNVQLQHIKSSYRPVGGSPADTLADRKSPRNQLRW